MIASLFAFPQADQMSLKHWFQMKKISWWCIGSIGTDSKYLCPASKFTQSMFDRIHDYKLIIGRL